MPHEHPEVAVTPDSMTISETIDAIRQALRDYIEATYHIGSPEIVRQRRQLLDEPGTIFQVPYIESTPRYATGPSFSELGLPPAALELFQLMTNTTDGDTPLLYDPPYLH